jgi:acyl-CoA reductase-like NAD-dependent aldehyde dehydrogenase
MRAQLRRQPEWFEYYAAVAQTFEGAVPDFGPQHLNVVTREALGVIGALTPWNHPLHILIKKVAVALAAGNSVVVKPSELAPITAVEMARIAVEAGLPPGVFNVVPGFGPEAGRALVEDHRIAAIDLTGGTATGRMVAEIAGRNLTDVFAELGGKAAVVVFDDTDPDRAAAGAAFAAFIATGQSCIQGARLLVQSGVHDEVVERLVRTAEGIRLGDPMERETQMGPLVSAGQLERVAGAVEQARDRGAQMLCGGERPTGPPLDRGYFYSPTVIGGVGPDDPVAQEEIFGPVVVVLPFEDEEEAVATANRTRFGLGTSIWTDDGARALRVADRIEAGVIWVNDHHRIDPASPWGGLKDSGIGLENGSEAYLRRTRHKSLIVNKSSEVFDWFGTTDDLRYS